jgi:hypothetical protein
MFLAIAIKLPCRKKQKKRKEALSDPVPDPLLLRGG